MPLFPPSQTDLVVVIVAVSSALGLEYRVIMYKSYSKRHRKRVRERERSGLLLSTDGVPFAPTFLSRERPPAVCLCEVCVCAAPEIVSDCFDFDSTHLCVFLFLWTQVLLVRAQKRFVRRSINVPPVQHQKLSRSEFIALSSGSGKREWKTVERRKKLNYVNK